MKSFTVKINKRGRGWPIFKKLASKVAHLVSFRHEEVQVVTRQGHLQVGLDEPQVGRVSLESVDADDEVEVPANGAAVLVAVVEVRHRRRKPRDVAANKNVTI